DFSILSIDFDHPSIAVCNKHSVPIATYEIRRRRQLGRGTPQLQAGRDHWLGTGSVPESRKWTRSRRFFWARLHRHIGPLPSPITSRRVEVGLRERRKCGSLPLTSWADGKRV